MLGGKKRKGEREVVLSVARVISAFHLQESVTGARCCPFQKWPVSDFRDIWERWHSRASLGIAGVFPAPSVFLLLIQHFQYVAVVSEAFRSLVPRRFFCTYVHSDLCSLQRLFTRETVEVRRGENKATPDLKLLHVFTPVREAGRGLEERERGGVAEEATVILASATARAFFSMRESSGASS